MQNKTSLLTTLLLSVIVVMQTQRSDGCHTDRFSHDPEAGPVTLKFELFTGTCCSPYSIKGVFHVAEYERIPLQYYVGGPDYCTSLSVRSIREGSYLVGYAEVRNPLIEQLDFTVKENECGILRRYTEGQDEHSVRITKLEHTQNETVCSNFNAMSAYLPICLSMALQQGKRSAMAMECSQLSCAQTCNKCIGSFLVESTTQRNTTSIVSQRIAIPEDSCTTGYANRICCCE